MKSSLKSIRTEAFRGVTLVEIAIVLVIIGLLLGGILKGQELINNSKVRSIADRQNSLKVAWFAFIDRYQAMPGDFIDAHLHIPGAVAIPNVIGDGYISYFDSAIAFQNMAGAGLLRCPQCTETKKGKIPTATNSLQNTYGGIMSIWADDFFYIAVGGSGNRPRLQIHTGPRIPSNIISEVDRKLDDGIANTGDFVMNELDPENGLAANNKYIGGLSGAGTAACTSTSKTSQQAGIRNHPAILYWRHANASPSVEQNCGGSIAI